MTVPDDLTRRTLAQAATGFRTAAIMLDEFGAGGANLAALDDAAGLAQLALDVLDRHRLLERQRK